QSTGVQAKALIGCERALRQEAETLLPQRLKQLADKHDYSYTGVDIKKLKSRWGSCNQHHHISLNLYLMMLPWALIDYVLLHELNHTKHLNHSPSFWTEIETKMPHAKQLRKQLRAFQPSL
ncbi:MAG: M48 family metallopeptidase, partial [Candidatus Saccharimonadales bacterium]